MAGFIHTTEPPNGRSCLSVRVDIPCLEVDRVVQLNVHPYLGGLYREKVGSGKSGLRTFTQWFLLRPGRLRESRVSVGKSAF